jgi:hypothetical protein
MSISINHSFYVSCSSLPNMSPECYTDNVDYCTYPTGVTSFICSLKKYFDVILRCKYFLMLCVLYCLFNAFILITLKKN